MPRSSAGVTRPRENLFHLEAGLSQTIAECLIGTGRPYGQYTSRPQRRESRSQTTSGIKPVISIPGQSLGTVVYVQQDGIIGTLLLTQYPGDIGFAYRHPVVSERMAGKIPHGTKVPRHYLRYQLGHDHLALSAQSMQHGPESVSHAQSAD
ncbi:MAG: hypothetical protein ACLQCB_11810 [Spirochaetia bacterium]